LGLNNSILSRRSIPSLQSFGTIIFHGFFSNFLNVLFFQDSSFSRSFQSSFVGVPMTSNIFSIWFSSDYPGNRGLSRIISKKIHPMLQISIVVEYFLDPRRTSGGRYHKVTTSFVWFLTGIPMARASPKSASLRIPSYSKLHRKSEIYITQKYVLRFQISMKNFFLVTKSNGN
jgi:hypothetical protein